MKLLVQVERSLNSAEAAEIAAQSDPAVAARYMKDAGLRFLPEPPPLPPPTPEDKNATATTTGTTSSKSVVESATHVQVVESKALARDGGSSRTKAGGKTAAQKAAAKTATDMRRPPPPSAPPATVRV